METTVFASSSSVVPSLLNSAVTSSPTTATLVAQLAVWDKAIISLFGCWRYSHKTGITLTAIHLITDPIGYSERLLAEES